MLVPLFDRVISPKGEPFPTITLEFRTSLREPILFEAEQCQMLTAFLALEDDFPRIIYGPLLQLRRIIHASPFGLSPFLEENGIAVRRGAPPVTKLLYP